MKYRLYEEIKKKRIQLSVNDEINILVDSFYEDEDLEIILKKNKFEELISDLIKKINTTLINEYYFEKEKYEYTTTSLSVPDFYTKEQKEKLKIICESIGLKDIEIYNESSAITMYYGYI